MKKVSIGSTISVKFKGENTVVFELVDPTQADAMKSKISVDSLFGQAAIGMFEGELIDYRNSDGKSVHCKIIKIE